ncbi:hypothetical protein, partial [Nocardia abscessus]|uniref:hypothetical protein n=1 Tax=Nocardia abscessus TaxID=120957 RepID=UPI002456E49E
CGGGRKRAGRSRGRPPRTRGARGAPPEHWGPPWGGDRRVGGRVGAGGGAGARPAGGPPAPPPPPPPPPAANGQCSVSLRSKDVAGPIRG